MPIYRNQTPTMTQIRMLSNMHITTTQEAVAYLRAQARINEQVAYVLQRASLKEQQMRNTKKEEAAPAPVGKPETVIKDEPVPVETGFVPEDLSTDEGYSDSEVKAKVAKLKKAKKSK